MSEVKIQPPSNQGVESLRWLAANRYQEIGEEWEEASMGVEPQRPPYEVAEDVVVAALDYVGSQKVGYRSGASFYDFILGGEAVAHLTIQKNDDNTARVETFNVLKPLQGCGLGGRLMRSAVNQLKADGVKELFSDNISRQAFMLRAAILARKHFDFTRPMVSRAKWPNRQISKMHWP